MNSLDEISWKVDEPTYRADPALSYSTLAKYEREGRFNSLPTLFDKIETPSLTFGSMVDTLITGSEEEFREQFIVIDDPGLSDSLKEITQILYSLHKEDGKDLKSLKMKNLQELVRNATTMLETNMPVIVSNRLRKIVSLTTIHSVLQKERR